MEEKQSSLGNTTENVSSRARRYKLQAVAGKLLPEERVSWCLHAKAQAVEIVRNGEKCYYRGLLRCGSAWVCPVCSAKISEERKAELEKAASLPGYSLLFLTLTLQHERDDKLASLIEELNRAWRSTRGGRKWQELEEKYKLVASVSSLEITFGLSAGWHPHKHVLLWSTLPESEIDIEELKRELVERWRSILARRGKYASEFYGLDIEIGQKPVASYLAKSWGASQEMTKAQFKTGNGEHYTPFQLLELASNGELWPALAFKEYAQATKNKRQLFWSRGARELFGLGEESTDEEIAQSEEQEPEKEIEVVATITLEQWLLVSKKNMRGELLDVAERGGAPAVEEFIAELVAELEKVLPT